MWAEDKKLRAAEIFLVAAATAAAAWLRLANLGRLGLWGDEGFTYLSVEGVLGRLIPILPSGAGYYKDILFTYLASLPCIWWGMSEWTLRLANSFWGILLIPVFYGVGKRYLGAPAALLGAAILTFSHWEIEFARQARYYCQLQFFYLLALHFFYRGFVEGEKRLQKIALLFFLLATLTHQLAYSLVFCFVALIFLRGWRALFQWRAAVFALLFILWIGLLQYCELFLWKVGSVAHLESGQTVWQALFSSFHWGYFRQFYWLFPKMSWVALAGAVVLLARRAKEPVGFFAAVGVITLWAMGFGRAHLQPRYVFFLYPVFILVYLAALCLAARAAKALVARRFPAVGAPIAAAAFLVMAGWTLEACHPLFAATIPDRRYGEKLVEKFQSSTTLRRMIDYKTTGQFVARMAEPRDLVVGMHMIYHYIYAGRCDYWLWSGGKGTWDAIVGEEDRLRDRYLGIPLIRSRKEFEEFLQNSRGRRIWVITTPSLFDKGHIELQLAAFLESHPQNSRYHSPDGISRVYLFSKE